MIEYICDRCGKRSKNMTKIEGVPFGVVTRRLISVIEIDKSIKHLCTECCDKVKCFISGGDND